MYLELNKSNMELTVTCGVLEKYKPSKNIQEIQKAVAELKAKMDKFMAEEVEPLLMEVNRKIAQENDKYTAK